ncbi:MAG: hypothetical protein WBL45_11205 [Solirubrobacterales bacterium]
MRKLLIPIFLLVAFFAGAAASADAATYRGGGEGIEVEFRVKGQRIVYARIAAGLYCTRPHRGRYRNRIRSYFGSKDPPLDATVIHTFPVPVHQSGRFMFEDRGEEDSGFDEELLSGRVRHGSVSGSFRSLSSYDAECRTGDYQRFGNRNLAKDTLRFRARRQ